jgi:nitrite reductase/ring-hydroxylating ferredoxin subunit
LKLVSSFFDENELLFCLKTEITEDRSKVFSISGDKGTKQDIAVFNIGGNFYAISKVCAHKGGQLNQGIFE